MNVSEYYLLLFYINMGSSAYALLQIIVATAAFQHKTNNTICDKLVLPITVIHITISMGAFIWCHVARFSHSGMVCSGAYLEEDYFLQVKDFQHDLITPEWGAIETEVAKSYLILEG